VDPDNYEPWDMEAFQAISRNDISKLRKLLEDGKCFDACNLNGETLLHLIVGEAT
jgi:hypothetical protein